MKWRNKIQLLKKEIINHYSLDLFNKPFMILESNYNECVLFKSKCLLRSRNQI